jgi:N6-L-threonylcarbamoyladenine synthase
MLGSGDLNFSFSGLKTAVLTTVRGREIDDHLRAAVAAEFQAAIVEVLVAKAAAALDQTGLSDLVVAGGVGANRQLREAFAHRARRDGFRVFYPDLEFCTDNGAMIAFAAALRLQDSGCGAQDSTNLSFTVRPRWDLETLGAPKIFTTEAQSNAVKNF